jgi:hypothetical protein
MKVKELINQLQRMDQESEVMVENENGVYPPDEFMMMKGFYSHGMWEVSDSTEEIEEMADGHEIKNVILLG